MVGLETAWINFATLSPVEMYSYNVCVSSSVIVQHAALRELDFSGLCL